MIKKAIEIAISILKIIFKSVDDSADLFLCLFILITITGGILMAKKLTAGVLQGASYTETMKVTWGEDTFEVEIRALNNNEASEIQSLMQEGVNIKGKPGKGGKMERSMDVDMKAVLKGKNQSDIKAVALGTTDKSLTEKVVTNEFPLKLVKEIGNRIKEITGIKEDKDIEAFNEGEENPSKQGGKQ